MSCLHYDKSRVFVQRIIHVLYRGWVEYFNGTLQRKLESYVRLAFDFYQCLLEVSQWVRYALTKCQKYITNKRSNFYNETAVTCLSRVKNAAYNGSQILQFRTDGQCKHTGKTTTTTTKQTRVAFLSRQTGLETLLYCKCLSDFWSWDTEDLMFLLFGTAGIMI